MSEYKYVYAHNARLFHEDFTCKSMIHEPHGDMTEKGARKAIERRSELPCPHCVDEAPFEDMLDVGMF